MRYGLPDRRSSERFQTHLEGWIASEATRVPIDCIVSDLSHSGICFAASDGLDIPLEFELQIPSHGVAAKLRLVWTTGRHYGAEFLD